jgi:hypothetical protein
MPESILTGLLISTGTARPLFAVSLRDAANVALALFATLFCAFASAAAGTSLFLQILVVDYHPLTKTGVVGSPAHASLYDDAYRVDVRNSAGAAADVSGNAGIPASGFSYTPTTALVEGVHGLKPAITDKRGKLPQANWSFTTRSAPEITEVTPKDVVLNAQSVAAIAATYHDAGAGIDVTRTQLLLDGVDVTALAKHDSANPDDSSVGIGIVTGKIKRVDNINVTARTQIGATQDSYPPAVALAGGTPVVPLSVADKAGNVVGPLDRATLGISRQQGPTLEA